MGCENIWLQSLPMSVQRNLQAPIVPSGKNLGVELGRLSVAKKGSSKKLSARKTERSMMGTAKASATRMQRVVSEDSNRSSNCRSWGRGASGHEVTEPRERKKHGCHKPKDNAKKETIKCKIVSHWLSLSLFRRVPSEYLLIWSRPRRHWPSAGTRCRRI
jgi:hypothetical protein